MQPTKTSILYGGKIIIDFYEARHWYKRRDTDEIITSVTGATSMVDKSRPLIYWAVGLMRDNLLQLAEQATPITTDHILEASKLHQKRKEEAATKGSDVHSWIEQYINSKLKKTSKPGMPKDEQILNGVLAFLKWEKEHKVKFLATEKIVYSRKYNYVGIMDSEAIIDSKRSPIDFKTGNAIYNEARYQVAAYQAADEEETGEKYDGDKWIIRFDKNTADFYAQSYGEQNKDFKTFLGALQIKNRTKELS